MAPYVYVENGKVTTIPNRHTVDSGAYSWWREGPTGTDFIHEDVTPNFFRRAETYITEKAKSRDPFFLYLALPSPHTPILPTKEWQGKSNLLPYANFVMMIDDYVGKLMRNIKEAGIEDNTLIIFTSDNGCAPYAGIKELQEMGHYPSYIYRGNKSDIFEGGHRVPFIAKWPGKIKKGTESNQLICTTDLMATLADIVGYALHDDEGEDSFSMLPLFNQTDTPIREAVVHHSAEGVFAIRKNEWKLIMAAGSGGWSFPNAKDDQAVMDTLPSMQLYNLKTDPGETSNLMENNPEVVAGLKSLLTKYIQDGRSSPGKPQQNDPIDFEWKQLQFMK
jgi:arylsulfatase A-like enzyme